MNIDRSKLLKSEIMNSRWLEEEQLLQLLYPELENIEDNDDTVGPSCHQKEKSVEQEDVNVKEKNTIDHNNSNCSDVKIKYPLLYSCLQKEKSVKQEDVNIKLENPISKNHLTCYDYELFENNVIDISWLQVDETVTQENMSILQENMAYDDDPEYSDFDTNEEDIRELEMLRDKEYTFKCSKYPDIEIDENKIAKQSKKKLQEKKFVILEKPVWENDTTSMKLFPFESSDRNIENIFVNDATSMFRQLFTDDLIDHIVNETNVYATDMLSCPIIRQYYELTSWEEVTRDEILIFCGLLLHMGNIKLDRLSDYWNKEQLFGLRVFANNMSYKRFTLLLRMLHFGEKQSNDKDDQLSAIRNIIDYFNKRMLQIYRPDREIILDESLAFWRGQFLLRQHIPNKYDKYGVRIFTVQTSTGVVLKCSMYTGVLDDYDENEHCEKVTECLHEFLNIGHSVYSNNDYNSFELAKVLSEKRTHFTGYIQQNRKTLPEEIVQIELMLGESICKYADDVMIGKWNDTRDCTYISNEYKNYMILIKTKQNGTKLIPLPINQSNINIRKRIIKQKRLLTYYPLEKDNIRCHVKLFIHLLQLMVTNAYIIYNQFVCKNISLDYFRLFIIGSILMKPTNKLCKIQSLYTTDQKSTHVVDVIKLKKIYGRKRRKRCDSCKSKGIIKYSNFICNVCEEKPIFCTECVKITHTV